MTQNGNRRPRVAVLGKTRSILSWFEDLQQGFAEAGAEVRGIGIQPELPEERWLQKREKLRELDNPRVVERLAGELAAFGPDLVVVQNKAGVPEKAWEAWQEILAGTPVVGWLCDNLNRPPRSQAACFERVYYFDSGCLPALEAFYGDRAEGRFSYLPLAVNPARYPLMEAGKRKPAIVFAGKCSKHRREFFRQVRRRGIPLEVYGPGCGDWLRPWRGRRIGALGLAKLYAGHLACLNLPQPGNTEQGLNLRAFEAPCCGGVGLYPPVPDLPQCFEPGKEILVYDDLDGLGRLVRELVGDPARAEAVARAGRERVLGEHTFVHRAQRMLADAGF